MVDDSLMEPSGMKIRHSFSGKFIQKGMYASCEARIKYTILPQDGLK
jgi:hypothetical protein